MLGLKEERDKLIDNAANKMRQLVEKWNDRLTLDNLRLSDRYLKGEVEILVHMRGRAVGPGDAGQFCAALKRYREPTGRLESDRLDGLRHELFDEGPKGGVLKEGVCGIEVPEAELLDAVSDDKQDAVLIGIVQLAEHPERLIPTSVRLDGLDETYRVRADSLYLVGGSFFKFGRSIVDWKADFVDGPSAMSLDQSAGQVVERGAQVVNSIPRDQREVRGKLPPKPKDAIAGLRVLVTNKEVWVGFSKGSDPLFEITDVVVGPFDFRPDAEQPV